MKILVTGAAGFIGSAFVRKLITETDHSVIAFARNTHQRNLTRLDPVLDDERVRLVFGDLLNEITGLCEGVDAVVNFAALTYVDHSIKDVLPFVEANTLGTARLLEEARRQGVKKFCQVSTDEVYGSIRSGAYTENARLNPTNPYSAAKAGADCLAIAYAHTFGMHTIVTRTENNYGNFQNPQKAMPTFIRCALQGKPIPVYGDGSHIRQWLYVDDHCDAILALLQSDKTELGEVFHVAGRQELSNLNLAQDILDILGKPHSLISFIDDHGIRPGHDWRYALDCTKIKERIGWQAKTGLKEGLEKTARWYVDNQWWLN